MHYCIVRKWLVFHVVCQSNKFVAAICICSQRSKHRADHGRSSRASGVYFRFVCCSHIEFLTTPVTLTSNTVNQTHVCLPSLSPTVGACDLHSITFSYLYSHKMHGTFSWSLAGHIYHKDQLYLTIGLSDLFSYRFKMESEAQYRAGWRLLVSYALLEEVQLKHYRSDAYVSLHRI